ncbi:MICOS complex subunit MIC27-like [Pomacea canaliculata]|uniref:MICOS complex subunit MIC27-like n=1 Tax=Pomacea canaliculata TaxID=400727 RepID=UPI000D73BE4E|nr:MICOS complex subunit MIC27-like [Pomacea canaliculata]XP_025089756.1 MICOS complex subunit MIC27-like [Pomacea canaliculata]
MASHRVSRLIKAGAAALLSSAPVMSFTVYAVSAVDNEERKVRVSELSLYENPEEGASYSHTEEDINFVRRWVSTVRKTVWDFKDSCQDTIDRIRNVYETGNAHTQEMLNHIQNDPGVLPRAGVIAVAGLGGVIAGYRGGMFRKVLYSTASITAASAICYPEEAIALAIEAYKSVQTSVKPLWSSEGSATEEASTRPSVLSSAPDATPYGEKTQSGTALKGDPGQSKEEDKDMYTTRSS